MINISFCFENDADLIFMEKEISLCFHQRGIDIATSCSHNAHELEDNIQSFCPDILFCDSDNENDFLDQTILSLKELNPYLISVKSSKNLNRKQLWSYASHAYEASLKDIDYFPHYHRPCYIYTPVNDIFYFASEGRKTILFSNEGSDYFYKKLDEVEEVIQNKSCQFLRIHKSYLVNINYISGYSRNYVKLFNGERLKISSYSYYKKINQTLKMKPTH